MKKYKFENVFVPEYASPLQDFVYSIHFSVGCFVERVEEVISSANFKIRNNNWLASALVFVFILFSIFASFVF
jgi:hypothetical protein